MDPRLLLRRTVTERRNDGTTEHRNEMHEHLPQPAVGGDAAAIVLAPPLFHLRVDKSGLSAGDTDLRDLFFKIWMMK